jgi:hypothetical protein
LEQSWQYHCACSHSAQPNFRSAEFSAVWAYPPDIECKKLERLATACLKNAEDKLAIYVLPRADYLDIVSLGMGEITQDFTWRLI